VVGDVTGGDHRLPQFLQGVDRFAGARLALDRFGLAGLNGQASKMASSRACFCWATFFAAAALALARAASLNWRARALQQAILFHSSTHFAAFSGLIGGFFAVGFLGYRLFAFMGSDSFVGSLFRFRKVDFFEFDAAFGAARRFFD
jgi:hypothetical protein